MAHHPSDSPAFCNEPSAAGPDFARGGALTSDATPSGSEATVTGRQEPRNDEGRNALSQPSKDGGESSNDAPGSAVSKRKLAKAEYENEYSERKKQLAAIGLFEEEPENTSEEELEVPSKLPSRAAYMRAYRQRKKDTAQTERRRQEDRVIYASTSCGRENTALSRKRQEETGQIQRKRRRASACSPHSVETVHQTRQRHERQKRRGTRQRGDPRSGIENVARQTTRRQRSAKQVADAGSVDSSAPNVSEPVNSSDQDAASSSWNASQRDLK